MKIVKNPTINEVVNHQIDKQNPKAMPDGLDKRPKPNYGAKPLGKVDQKVFQKTEEEKRMLKELKKQAMSNSGFKLVKQF